MSIAFKRDSNFKEKRQEIMIKRYENPLERKKQSDRLSQLWIIINPKKESFIVKNLNKFCKENFDNYRGFRDGLYRVSKGIQNNYKNWKCEKLAEVVV